MATIPAGYTLAIVNDGTIVDTIDLEGYDLGKPAAALSVAVEVDAAIRAARHAEDAADERDRSRRE